jgi:hypothetical protein
MVAIPIALPFLSGCYRVLQGLFAMDHEKVIEDLLKSSAPTLARVGPIIEALDDPGRESFRVLQEQLKIQGRVILRLAAALNGLTKELEALKKSHGAD